MMGIWNNFKIDALKLPDNTYNPRLLYINLPTAVALVACIRSLPTENNEWKGSERFLHLIKMVFYFWLEQKINSYEQN